MRDCIVRLAVVAFITIVAYFVAVTVLGWPLWSVTMLVFVILVLLAWVQQRPAEPSDEQYAGGRAVAGSAAGEEKEGVVKYDKFGAYRPKSEAQLLPGIVLHFRRGDSLWRIVRVDQKRKVIEVELVDDDADGFYPVGTPGSYSVDDVMALGRIAPEIAEE